jgi:hypothetical protein
MQDHKENLHYFPNINIKVYFKKKFFKVYLCTHHFVQFAFTPNLFSILVTMIQLTRSLRRPRDDLLPAMLRVHE